MDRVTPLFQRWVLALSMVVMLIAAVLLINPSDASAKNAEMAPACAPQPTNLTAWWRFEGNFSDYKNSIPTLGTTNITFAPGKVGQAVTFPSTGAQLTASASSHLDPGTGDFSVAAWVKTTGSGVQTIIDDRASVGVSGYVFYLYNGRPGVQLSTASSNQNFGPTTGTQYNDGLWHYIAISVDRDNASGIKMYADGSLVATFNPTSYQGSLTNSAGTRIGHDLNGTSASFGGSIDELDFYKRAITSSEVQSIYSAGVTGKCLTTTPPTNTPTPTKTNTPTPTKTNTPVPTNTFTPTPTKTNTPTPTKTNTPTATAPPTNTPTSTSTPEPPTATPVGPTPTLPPVTGTYRDIGNVRIWADGFVDGSTSTASGNIRIGNATTNQAYFKISGSASWTSSGVITIQGRLETYGNGTDIGLGTFTIDRTTGNVTWTPSAEVLYTKIGTSEIAITPSITVNVRNPQVTVQAQINVALPEDQSINGSVTFSVGQHGQISGGTSLNLNLKFAGGTLTGTIGVSDQGLTASQVQYTLPTIGSVNLYELVIDGKGTTKLHFGSSATFPIPDLNLGNNVFVLTNLQGTVGLTYTNTTGAGQFDYLVDLSGTLSLSGLPKNGSVSVPGFNLGISSGKVYGKVRDLSIKVAGKDLDIGEAEFETQLFAQRGNRPDAFTYVLTTDWASYDIGGSWLGSSEAKVDVRNVILSTAAPYITIGGVGGQFNTTEPFYLGGNANSAVSIKFDELSGKFRYDLDLQEWTSELTTTITFKFGNDSAVFDDAHLTIDDGAVSGSLANATLKIAGFELKTTELKFQNNVWTATTASLKLPASWGVNASITLNNVVIDQNGIRINGAGGSFSTTQAFYLGGNANSKVSVKFDQLSGSFNYNSTTKLWNATVNASITFKFGTDSVLVDNVTLNFSNGNVSATLNNLTLKIAGLELAISQLQYQNDTFTAASAQLKLPASWGVNASVTLSAIRITKDGLTIGSAGASFSTTQAFYLGGNASSNASVKFDQLSGSFAYTSGTGAWTINLQADITFKFGTDSTVVDGASLTIAQGNVSGSISAITFKIAGLELYVGQLAYNNSVFTAGTVNLKLPQAWGGVGVSITGLEISKDGVKIGGAGGSFSIPDQNIAGVLRITGMTGSVSIDAQKNYSIILNGTITIQKVSSAGNPNGASVTGTLKIQNGRVSGSISAFSFKLVGVEFSVTNAQFVDNKITAQQVTLKLPSALGNAQTTLYGLEVGGDAGFKISGGSFRLPDFTMGGVGVQNVQAEIIRETNGNYSISAGAKLNFVQFSIEGRFKVAYNPTTSNVSLREVYVAFEGRVPTTAIPIGTTGFYLTKVWGSFNMDTNSLNVAFGVRASTAFSVGNKPLVGLEGSVYVQVRPSFEFRTNANASLLGLQVANVDLRITRTSFSLEAQLHAGIIHAALEIAFGKDTANEFTFYGRATLDVMIPRGFFVNKRWLKIPRNDWRLFSAQFDAGKFRHNGNKVWGARYSGRIFGFSYFAFARFSPSLGMDVGRNLNEYQPIRPAYRPDLPFLKPTDNVYEVDVAHPTNELTIAEGITDTNLLNSQDMVILSPNNVPFTKELVYQEDDGSQRIYSITLDDPAQAVGKWTIIVQDGNEIAVFGVIPAPQVDQFSACTATNLCLDTLEAGQTATPVNLEVGETLDLTWETSHVSAGLSVDLYAEGSDGSVHILGNDYTETGTSLSGSTSWTPLLPAGLYTITLRLDDQLGASTFVTKMPINLTDTTAPNALVNLQAAARADGSVLVTWDTTQVAPDVRGYEFVVDGGSPIAVEEVLTSYDLYGLEPGVAHTISVVTYDHTGNRSAAATTSVTLNELSVVASWPTRGMSATLIDRVEITFNQPVVVDSFTVVDANGQAVPGSIVLISQEQGVDNNEVIGAEFIPSNGMLPLGSYTSTVVVRDAVTNAPTTVEWPFEVVAPAIRVYLPSVQR